MSPIRCRAAFSWVLASLLVLSSVGSAQQPTPLNEAQKEKLRERDALLKQIRELLNKGKADDALPLFEKMIALEKAVYGEENLDAADSLVWLGDIQFARSDWAAAAEARSSALNMYRKLLGEKHWQTINARLARADVTAMAKMSAEQREQLKQADQLAAEAVKLYKDGEGAEAAAKDRQVVAIRKEILGDHRRTAASYTRLAADLRRMKKYGEAKLDDEKALAMRQKLLGEEHPDTADSYESLGEDSRRLNDYVEAEKCDRLALAIWRKVRGDEHSDTLLCIVNLANDLYGQKRYPETIKLEKYVLEVRTRKLGKDHADTRSAMTNLGYSIMVLSAPILDESPSPLDPGSGDAEKRLRSIGKLFWGQEAPEELTALKTKLLAEAALIHDCAYELRGNGKFDAGNRLQRIAFSLRRDILGPHQDTVKSGYLLAWGFYKVGDFKAAEYFDRQSLAMAREALGPKHALTMHVLRNLAYDIREQSRYVDAEELDRQSLALNIEINGEYHQETASLCNNLGFDLSHQGRYAEADLLHRRALAIDYKVLGEDHPETLVSMNNVACLLRTFGQESEAQKMFWRINEIILKAIKGNVDSNFKKVQRIDYVFFARNCLNLSIGLQSENKYAAAESMLSTLAFPFIDVECIARPNDKLLQAETAALHHQLAQIQFAQKKYKECFASEQEAYEVTRRVFGAEHPRTLQRSVHMAYFSLFTGDSDGAEKTLRKIVAVEEQVLGSDNPVTVKDTACLVQVLWLSGKFKAAEEVAWYAYDNFLKARLRFNSGGLDRSNFNTEVPVPGMFLAALAARDGRPQEAWKYLEASYARGLLDELSARNSRPLKAEERSEEERIQGEIAFVESRLGTLAEIKAADPEQISKLRVERNQKMLQLGEFQARMEKRYGPAAGQVYQMQAIQSQLQPDAAMIGWLDINGVPGSKWTSGEHWAFVLRAKGDPVFVRARGSEMDGAWGKEDSKLTEKALKAISSPGGNIADESVLQLYRQRLEPLEAHFKPRDGLPAVKHLIVMPSPALLGVPIEVLARYKPESEEVETNDRFLVSYAPSGTMHAYLQENRKDFGKECGNLLALADPAFTEDQFKLAKSNDGAALAMRGLAPTPLPGTRGEVEAIAKLFRAGGGKVLTLLGTAASGKNLDALASQKKLQEFRYLHLATHGTPDPLGGMNSYLSLTSDDFRLLPYAKLTAGHILRTWKLDADLVTLSACQSAIGQTREGEGYVGFSQAFFLASQKGAGARTVVMSQWQVNDLSTAILMERFYQNLLGQRKDLKEPMGKLAALFEARHYLRNLTKLEALDRLKSLSLDIDSRTGGTVVLSGRQPFAHPFFWAPFILVGDAGTAKAAP